MVRSSACAAVEIRAAATAEASRDVRTSLSTNCISAELIVCGLAPGQGVRRQRMLRRLEISAPRAAIAVTIAGAARLGRAARQAHARIADPRRGEFQLLEEDRLREVIALGIADLGRSLQVG